jgi:asparagine N-glycosylation enzyme membrane subunit Stt3
MRWTLAHALIVVLIAGLALGVVRLFWGHSSYFDSRILFAVFLAVLSTASLA